MRRVVLSFIFAVALALGGKAQVYTVEDSLNWGLVSAQQVEQLSTQAALGHSFSLYALGRCFLSGLGVEKNRYKAAECFAKAAEKDHTQALYYMGFCYRFGYGVAKDDIRANSFFNKAVKWLEIEMDKDPYAPY